MHNRREKLVAEFPELLSPDVTLQKEVYAHFGLLMFHFSLVEHSLINIVMISRAIQDIKERVVKDQPDWERATDKHFEFAKKQTFGNLIKLTLDITDFKQCASELEAQKGVRDYFAHHFFRDEISYFGTDEGCWFLLEQIADARASISAVEEKLKPLSVAYLTKYKIKQPGKEFIESTISSEYSKARKRVLEGRAQPGWVKQ